MKANRATVPRPLRSFPAARVSVGLAAALLVGAVGLMGSLLFPEGWSAIAAIWFLSVVILASGFWFAYLDVRWLDREWQALAGLSAGEAARFEESDMASSRDPGDRELPLIAQRAAFIAELSDPKRQRNGKPPADFRSHLRTEASAASAHVGTVTRFLSSVLLLLAVIGTFAGMKAALPELVNRIQQAGQPIRAPEPGTGGTVTDPFLQIGAALSPVADAFGANFLALLGSLALGLIAYGSHSERRGLLYQLERVSERLLYWQVPASASADALERAVAVMKQSTEAVSQVGTGIEALQSSIGGFEKTLSEAIEGLKTSFEQSLQQQSGEIDDKLNETVGRMLITLQDVSSALGTTAVSYEGLVAGLRERDQGVRQASVALQAATTDIADSVAGYTAALEALPARLDAALDRALAARQDGAATENVSGAKVRVVESSPPAVRSI